MESRRKAYRLVYDLYVEKEYAQAHPSRLWLSIFDALPETATLLVERVSDGAAVGALTVIFDSPIGLPADSVYGAELDALRASGRKLSEIVSLGVAEGLDGGPQVLVQLYVYGSLIARRLRGATDFVVTVNPRHAFFYRRKLLFSDAGPERSYEKVGGAPALLLRLDFEDQLRAMRACRGPEAATSPLARTPYRFCHREEGEPAVAAALSRALRPMSEREMRYFFMEKTKLFTEAPARQRRFIEDCYPFYDLTLTTAETREFMPV